MSIDPRVTALAKRMRDVERKFVALSTSRRLANSSLEDSSLPEYDADGDLVTIIGKQPDGTHGVVDYHGPIPPAPIGLEAKGGPVTVTAIWGGQLAQPRPLDLHLVEVYASREPFEHFEEAQIVGAIVDVDGGQVTFARESGDWHIGLVAVSRSGKRSAVSPLASAAATSVLDSEVLEELEGKLEEARAELAIAFPEGAYDLFDEAVILKLWVDLFTAKKITAAEADLGSFVADEGFVGDLQALIVTADVFQGREFVGGTFTGASFRTAASGRRWEMLSDESNRIYGRTGVEGEEPGYLEVGGPDGYRSVVLRGAGADAAEVIVGESVTLRSSRPSTGSGSSSNVYVQPDQVYISAGSKGQGSRVTLWGDEIRVLGRINAEDGILLPGTNGVGHVRHGSPIFGAASAVRPLRVAFGTHVASGSKRTIAHNAGFSAIFHIGLTLRDQKATAREVVIGDWMNENGFDCYVYTSSGANAGTARVDYLVVGY